MSQPAVPDNSPRPSQPASRRIRVWVWLLVLALVGPCAFVQTPREVGRWYLAAAQVEREAGREQLADQYMSRAQDWAPDLPVILLTRAAWRREDGQYQAALDDLNALVEQFPDNAEILSERTAVLQHLGRHAEAVSDYKKIDRMSLTGGIPPRAEALNNLAYIRAVGKLELDEALKGANEALHIEPSNPLYRDTRGFILYQQGKYEPALVDLTAAVQGVEDWLKTPPRGYPIKAEHVAVVRYHRALVFEKLGRFADAKADRARAKLLIGREPDETLF